MPRPENMHARNMISAEQVIFRNMHITKINAKRGHKFERNQGG